MVFHGTKRIVTQLPDLVGCLERYYCNVFALLIVYHYLSLLYSFFKNSYSVPIIYFMKGILVSYNAYELCRASFTNPRC